MKLSPESNIISVFPLLGIILSFCFFTHHLFQLYFAFEGIEERTKFFGEMGASLGVFICSLFYLFLFGHDDDEESDSKN